MIAIPSSYEGVGWRFQVRPMTHRDGFEALVTVGDGEPLRAVSKTREGAAFFALAFAFSGSIANSTGQLIAPGVSLGRRRGDKQTGVPVDHGTTGNGKRVSPAVAAGMQAKDICHGCGREIPSSYARNALYCGTCRWRGGRFGWCGCGSALYSGAWCKPSTREARRWHREAAAAAGAAE